MLETNEDLTDTEGHIYTTATWKARDFLNFKVWSSKTYIFKSTHQKGERKEWKEEDLVKLIKLKAKAHNSLMSGMQAITEIPMYSGIIIKKYHEQSVAHSLDIIEEIQQPNT